MQTTAAATQKPQPGVVYSINFGTGKLEPIARAGLLPVGAVVTYQDRANPSKRYVVTGETFDTYGQAATCEDGHTTTVSKSACEGPGGWEDTGEVLTAEQMREFLTQASAEGERLAIERAEQERATTSKRAQQRAEYLQQYGRTLTTTEAAPHTSRHALAAKNIRTQLAAAFPGIKFRVTSEGNGGSSVRVSWDFGPTTAQVEAIIDRYSLGYFDGMEDLYTFNSNVWPELFGGAKYINAERGYPGAEDIIGAALCARWDIPQPAAGVSWWQVHMPNDHSGRNLANYIREILAADAYPPGAVITGLESVDPSRSADGWAAYMRATYTAPAPAAPTAPAAPAAGGAVTVTHNTEKNGVEIRFATKPAAAILDQLKAAGWRWSRFSSCWYARHTPEADAFAAQLAGLDPSQFAAGPSRAESGSRYTRFAGGGESFVNRRGRCEDAPCCGCCS